MSNKAGLILVTYKNYEILIEALTSIYLNTDSDDYDLFIIDNGNDKRLKDYPLINTTIINPDQNLYWAGGINKGLSLLSNQKYVFFLNDDIEVSNNWLENHIKVLEKNKQIGALGPLNSSPRDWQFYNKVRTNFKLGKILPEINDLSNLESINNQIANVSPEFTYIKGMLAFFCTAFRKETIDRVGLLNERFIMGGDDDAYCRELEKHGYELALLLNTFVNHKAGISINKLDNEFRKQISIDNSKLLRELYPTYYK